MRRRPIERRIVLIINRRARRLTGGTLLEALRAPRPGVSVVETTTLADLDSAANEVARAGPDAVVLAGGDGSYMAGVTALVRAFADAGRDGLPPIGLAPGGTVSTVARNWGFAGGGLFPSGSHAGAKYAARLLDAACSGRVEETNRPTLRVRDHVNTRVGFIFGAGLVSRFFEIYVADGARGYRGALAIVARIFAGSLTRGRLAEHVLAPLPCLVEIDGMPVPFDHVSLVGASVVRDLGLGMHLLYRAGERSDRFHVVASDLGPSRLGPQLPLVLAGRPLRGDRAVDTLAAHLTLRFPESGAYVLDGELLRAPHVDVRAGPVLRILSATSET